MQSGVAKRALVFKHLKRGRAQHQAWSEAKTTSRAIGRQATWALNHCSAVDRGLSNTRFAEHGHFFIREAIEKACHRAVIKDLGAIYVALDGWRLSQ